MTSCFHCRKPLDLEGKVSFRELCPHCGMDVHVCRNCGFFDPGRANHCREPMAENVRDPELRNTCEYFNLASSSENGPNNEAQRAKAALEALFKKN
jgi:ribosomal protein L40E